MPNYLTAAELKEQATARLRRSTPADRVTPADVYDALRLPTRLSIFDPDGGTRRNIAPAGATNPMWSAEHTDPHAYYRDNHDRLLGVLDALRDPDRIRSRVSLLNYLRRELQLQGDDPARVLHTLRVSPVTAWMPGPRRIVDVRPTRARLAFLEGDADPSIVQMAGSHVLSAIDASELNFGTERSNSVPGVLSAIVWEERGRTYADGRIDITACMFYATR